MKPNPARPLSGFVLAVASLALVLGASIGSAHAASASCTPADVTVFTSRIHIRCSQGTADGANTIYYFAVPTTDATFANRFMTIATTALVSGRRFVINFTSGASGASYGCLASDCRPANWFGIE